MKHKKTYQTWCDMRNRCHNPNAKQWPNYGGRGIAICERWRLFDNFLSDMGESPPGMTIDRIDNDGSYEPSNCRWATRKEQRHNQRTCHYLEYKGQKKPLRAMAEEHGISEHTVYHRISRLGWPVDKALETPVDATLQMHGRNSANARWHAAMREGKG